MCINTSNASCQSKSSMCILSFMLDGALNWEKKAFILSHEKEVEEVKLLIAIKGFPFRYEMQSSKPDVWVLFLWYAITLRLQFSLHAKTHFPLLHQDYQSTIKVIPSKYLDISSIRGRILACSLIFQQSSPLKLI